ncbi:hypothetical protein BX600DRAFT_88122 [Xylariales sp. PMI_506]|nr:hypothetical protein BX600DRAFT_88122 [Xylariales sp. PMI_506]
MPFPNQQRDTSHGCYSSTIESVYRRRRSTIAHAHLEQERRGRACRSRAEKKVVETVSGGAVSIRRSGRCQKGLPVAIDWQVSTEAETVWREGDRASPALLLLNARDTRKTRLWSCSKRHRRLFFCLKSDIHTRTVQHRSWPVPTKPECAVDLGLALRFWCIILNGRICNSQGSRETMNRIRYRFLFSGSLQDQCAL